MLGCIAWLIDGVLRVMGSGSRLDCARIKVKISLFGGWKVGVGLDWSDRGEGCSLTLEIICTNMPTACHIVAGPIALYLCAWLGCG
jgi:hypothetical protein